jgi:hypothetical protein
LAPIVPRKAAWVIGALALALLLGGLIGMWRAYASRAQWTADEARIRYSEIIGFGDETNPRYRIQVEFMYTAGNLRYVVPHSLPMTYPNRDAAQSDLLRYRPGSTHRIFYNNANPYEIVLDTGPATEFYVIPLLLIAAGAILGGGLVLKYFKTSRYSCVACGAGVHKQHAFCFHCGRRVAKRKGKLMT